MNRPDHEQLLDLDVGMPLEVRPSADIPFEAVLKKHLAGRMGYSKLRPRALPNPTGSPDSVNCGNLWVDTEGSQPTGVNDGCFATPTQGPNRGRLRQFMSTCRDAEVCGREFTPDASTLFFAIQHPGDCGNAKAPSSYWPDGELVDPDMPDGTLTQPRPSLIAITRSRGPGRIGK